MLSCCSLCVASRTPPEALAAPPRYGPPASALSPPGDPSAGLRVQLRVGASAGAAATGAVGAAEATVVVRSCASGATLFEVEVDLVVDSVASLQAAIQEKTGIQRERQRLAFGEDGCSRRDFEESTRLGECFKSQALQSEPSTAPPARAPAPAASAPPASSPSRPPVPRRRPMLFDVDEEPAAPAAAAPELRRPLSLDTVETPLLDTRVWSEDVFGTICHKPSGMRVSPQTGIFVEGVAYQLSPGDIELTGGSVLGSGSGGVVQVAWHRPSGKRIAVKTLRVGSDDAKRDQMLKEITGLAQSAGCPYLVQWYAGFADPSTGNVHVAIEFMDLGSLADLKKQMNGEGVPAKQAACIAAQILRGLHALQLRLLLHRDIKPENLLHNLTGRVKLTDFGISKSLGISADNGVGTTFVGTVTYMSPERVMGNDYSYQSDVWSAGMVIFELSLGKYPFSSTTFADIFECVCESPEPRLSENDFPRPLCDLVARCLTRDPAVRPCARALARHELVAGHGETDVAAFGAWLVDRAPWT